MDDKGFIAEMFPSMAKGAPAPAAAPSPAPQAANADPVIAQMFPTMVKPAAPAAATGQAPVAGAGAPGAAAQEGAAAAEQKQDGTAPAPLELEAPGGFSADDPTFAEFNALAGKHGLDQAKATELLQLHQRAVAAQQQAWDTQIGRWHEAIEKDAEIGGGQLQRTVDLANDAAARLGSPAFRELLKDPVYGSNPELVRFLARVGAELHGKGKR